MRKHNAVLLGALMLSLGAISAPANSVEMIYGGFSKHIGVHEYDYEGETHKLNEEPRNWYRNRRRVRVRCNEELLLQDLGTDLQRLDYPDRKLGRQMGTRSKNRSSHWLQRHSYRLGSPSIRTRRAAIQSHRQSDDGSGLHSSGTR